MANDDVGACPAGGVTIARALGEALLGVVLALFDGATLGGSFVLGVALGGAGGSDPHAAIPPLKIKATAINAPVRAPTSPLCRAEGSRLRDVHSPVSAEVAKRAPLRYGRPHA
jgi:hypothetical protein